MALELSCVFNGFYARVPVFQSRRIVASIVEREIATRRLFSLHADQRNRRSPDLRQQLRCDSARNMWHTEKQRHDNGHFTFIWTMNITKYRCRVWSGMADWLAGVYYNLSTRNDGLLSFLFGAPLWSIVDGVVDRLTVWYSLLLYYRYVERVLST